MSRKMNDVPIKINFFNFFWEKKIFHKILLYIDIFQHAFETLYVTRQRSTLALIGIAIGTASIIAIFNIGNNAAAESARIFREMGTDILIAQSTPLNDGRTRPIVFTDVLALPAFLSQIKAAAPISQDSANIAFHGRSMFAGVVGSNSALMDIANLTLLEGRFLSKFDLHTTFAVLGHGVARGMSNELNKKIHVGDTIRIENYLFTVIGILNETVQNPLIPVEFNMSVIVPLQSKRRLSMGRDISSILMRMKDDKNSEKTVSEVLTFFSARPTKSSLQVQSAQQLIENMEHQNRLFKYLLAGIACIALLVGGIGVMNVMLMGVAQRKTEIGLRMAIGAKKQDVLIMFLFEAITLTSVGGVVGAIFGLAAAYFVAYWSSWEFVLVASTVPLGIFISVAVGILFGIYPAVTAVRLNPAVALSSE